MKTRAEVQDIIRRVLELGKDERAAILWHTDKVVEIFVGKATSTSKLMALREALEADELTVGSAVTELLYGEPYVVLSLKATWIAGRDKPLEVLFS